MCVVSSIIHSHHININPSLECWRDVEVWRTVLLSKVLTAFHTLLWLPELPFARVRLASRIHILATGFDTYKCLASSSGKYDVCAFSEFL